MGDEPDCLVCPCRIKAKQLEVGDNNTCLEYVLLLAAGVCRRLVGTVVCRPVEKTGQRSVRKQGKWWEGSVGAGKAGTRRKRMESRKPGDGRWQT